MSERYQELFRPDVVQSVAGLSLLARLLADDFMAGKHLSQRVAHGLEFSQYKAYQPGDDMRLLDWKMLARSGRYYIKQADINSRVTVKFIIDASASMNHKEAGLSKIHWVRILVATLAYIAHQQGDSTGLFSLNNAQLKAIYPAAHSKHYQRMLNELIAIAPAGNWPDTTVDINAISNRSGRELLCILTDMHQQQTELIDWVKRLKSSRNEVMVLQVMGKNEMDFQYQGNVIFEDLETGEKIKANATSAKARYLGKMQQNLAHIRHLLLDNGIGYELFRMDTPLNDALKLFLGKRQHLS